MARRTSENIKFIDQAKFSVFDSTPLERAFNYAECLLCYSNKFGLAFIAKGSKLTVFSLLKLETEFSGGGEEQLLNEHAIVSIHDCRAKISMIKLSENQEFISIVTARQVSCFHVSMYGTKVENMKFVNIYN